jgi:mannan endo-1,4-beta-mannosidase
MKHRSTLHLLLLVCAVNSGFASDAKRLLAPVNPAASPEAVALYHFIQEIGGRYTLSGQHNFVGKGSAFTEQLEAMTGKSPVVWGSDFSFTVKGEDAMNYQHAGPANLPAITADEFDAIRKLWSGEGPQAPAKPRFLPITLEQARQSTIDEAKARYAKGHIITLMWHGGFPTDGNPCNGASVWAEGHLPSSETWEQLVTAGTPLNDAWKKGMDAIAGYLQQLQAAHIPVLWRPYHEMNGEWFWWGHQKGPLGYKRLWVMTYQYLTQHHGLNNLIWVWDANAPRDEPGERGIPYADFYPGDEYVDILATDIYGNKFKRSHYEGLKALTHGKPVALGEVGELPSLPVLREQPDWSWFMPWGWILFFSNDAETIKAIYQSERVLTLDEISRDDQGRYSVKKAEK